MEIRDGWLYSDGHKVPSFTDVVVNGRTARFIAMSDAGCAIFAFPGNDKFAFEFAFEAFPPHDLPSIKPTSEPKPALDHSSWPEHIRNCIIEFPNRR